MATVSPIARSLVDQVRIHYGFWNSRGTTACPPGPAVTVTTQVYAFLTAGIALFTAWVASRAWRIINFIIFRSIYQRTRASLEESQCAALVVNNPVPTSVLLTAVKLAHRGGPQNTLLKIGIASLFGVLLQATVPLYVFLFPPYKGGLIVPIHCGYDSVVADTPWTYVGKPKRFSNAALSIIDRNSSAVDEVKKANLLESLPNTTQSQSYVTQCPSGAICNPTYPFTFSSRYNLTSGHFGLNIDIPFTIYVNETCYRPVDAFVNINNTVQYGLNYGPVVIGDEPDIYTGRFTLSQGIAPGDTLVSYWALTDNVAGYNAWTPHPMLGLGGDTTILIYFVGYISLLEPSDDPIFATNHTSANSGLYLTLWTAVPIICDTKYQFCTDPHNCSPIGPMTHVLDWIDNPRTSQNDTWSDIYTFFNGSTFVPPIAAAAQGSDAIASDQTLSHGVVQTDPSRATVEQELRRLSQGGMASLASRSQLAALGYWDLGYGSTLQPVRGLCSNVAIEVPTALSIPLTPYVPYFCISIIIIIVSFADSLGATRVALLKKYKDAWVLYSVGQLHRQVAEQQWGTLPKADPGRMWPNLKSPIARGFGVAKKEGSMYLVSSPPSSAQLDTGYLDSAMQPLFSPPAPTSKYEYAHVQYPPRSTLPVAPQNPLRVNVPEYSYFTQAQVESPPLPPAPRTGPEHSYTDQTRIESAPLLSWPTTPGLRSVSASQRSYADSEQSPPLPGPSLPLMTADLQTFSDGRQESRPFVPQQRTQYAVSDPWVQHDPSTRSFTWRRPTG